MKMGKIARRVMVSSAAGSVVAAFGFGHSVHAAGPANTLYFDPFGSTPAAGTYSWDNTSYNWTNTSTAVASPAYLWPSNPSTATNYTAFFEVGSTNAAYNVSISGAQTVGEIDLNTGSFDFFANASTGGSLTIGPFGIITSGTASIVNTTFDASLGTILVSSSEQWNWSTGNGAKVLTFNNSTATTAAPGTSYALFTYASGGYEVFNGVISDGTTGGKMIVSRYDGGNYPVNLNGTNTYSGGTICDSGVITSNSTNALGTGPVYIGSGVVAMYSPAGFTASNYSYNGQTGFLVGPLGGIQFNGTAMINSSGGILAPIDPHSSGYVSLGYNLGTALNMSTIGNGSMFLGETNEVGNSSAAIFTYSASSLTAGAGNTYRLGAGGGTLNISNGILNDSGTTSNAVVIGMPNYNVSGSLGSGIVNLSSTSIGNNYSGGTIVNVGSTLSGNAIPNVNTFGTGPITLNSGKLNINGLAAVVTNTSLGDVTFSGTAQLSGTVTPAPGYSTTILIGGPSDPSPLTRSNQGVLQIATSGTGNVLGSGSGINVLVNNAAAAPVVTNGIVAPYFQDGSGNFLTYGSNGFAPDTTTSFKPSDGTDVNVVASGAQAMTGQTYSVNSLVLSGNVTDTGGSNATINIASGGLSFTAATTIGSATAGANVNLNFGTAEAILGGTSNATIYSTISNSIASASSPGLTISDKATVNLLGTNTFTGLVTVNGGSILDLNSDVNLGNAGNGLFINGGQIYINATGITTARTITLGSNGAFFGSATATTNLNGYITTGGPGTSANFLDFYSGNNSRFNLGNASLTTPNDFTAPIYVENRITLGVSQDNQLGNSANSITLNAIDNTSSAAGTPGIVALASFATSRNIVLTGAYNVGGQLDANSSAITFTINGTISGDSSLSANIASGDGTVILAGNNTYFGTTLDSYGTLQIGNGGATGTLGGGLVTVNSPGILAINRNNSIGITNAITGTGSFDQIGSGVTTLSSANNNYSGSTLVSAGTLAAGATNSLSFKSAFNITTGTLSTAGFSTSIASLTVGASGTLNLGYSNPLTVIGAASLNGTLTLTGTIGSLPDILMNYNSVSGTFSTIPTLPGGDVLSYGSKALEIVAGGASNLFWNNASSNNTWDTVSLNWNNGSGTVAYSNTSNASLSAGDNVTFGDNNGGAANYNVTISTVLNPTSTTVNNSLGNYVFSGAGAIAGPGALLKTGTGSLTLAETGSNAYSGGTNISQGTLILASANAFPVNSSLIVASGAELKINNSTGAIYMPQLSSLANSGTIDITNNGMIVHNGSIGTISTQVGLAYNNGTWTGTNASSGIITSTTAAGDTTHLTAVGVATGLTSFEGLSVASTDVLLKYTYYGDANLDGMVDGTDYSRIDNGYLNGLTGWYNGDFNYDGVIDGSDYTLIDNAFNSQGVQLAAEIASPTAQITGSGNTSAVPEPAALGLLGMGAVGLLGRMGRAGRRRR